MVRSPSTTRRNTMAPEEARPRTAANSSRRSPRSFSRTSTPNSQLSGQPLVTSPHHRRGQPGQNQQAGRSFGPHHNRPVSNAGRGPPQMNNMPYRSAAPQGLLRPRREWAEWQELSVRVRGLTTDINTWDIYNAFDKEGTITFIELGQARDGMKDGSAKVRFSPPPANDFWSLGHYPVKSEETGLIIASEVSLIPRQKERTWRIPSPVRKNVYYPERLKIFPLAMDFGFMFDPTTMMHMRSAPSRKPKDLVFQVDLLRKKLAIFFPYKFIDPEIRDNPAAMGHGLGQLARDNDYMVWIPFEQIEKIYSVDLDDRHTSLIISLDAPPCFFRKRQEVKRSHVKEANVWSEMDTWYRQTDIIYDPDTIKENPVALNKGEVEIDIGRWTTYRFVIPRNATNSIHLFKTVSEALRDFNIPTLPFEGFNTIPGAKPSFWTLIERESTNQSALSLLSNSQSSLHLDFEVRYQLEVCISQGVFLEHNLTEKFLAALAKLAHENTAKARSILEYFAEMGNRVHDPMTIFESKEAKGRAIRIKIPHYCAYARKATVTPSGIYFSTPSVETTNRVIRHFSDFGDRFLRVQFTDEKFEGRISSNVDKVKNDELYSRVYRTLVNGIVIGDRKYEFLAFGNSQFRQNGAYFFCPVDSLSCEDIRAWMGHFDHIKVVAKYAARLGQCFSTTRAIHGTKVEIGKIQDIERDGFNFSDGVGKISDFLAQMISTELGLPIASHIPSAFQFRLGGCKGILVVWPDVTGRQVKIRPSQQKFEAVYNGLEIIRCSHFSTATLNRQTITILSALGVPDDVFLDMLTKQLADYQTAMTDRSMALALLQKWIDENNMTITIASMIVSGFMDAKEPFLMSLLHLWRAWSIKLLKEKAKIMVEDGAFVLGCIDETATLKGHSNSARAHEEADIPEIFLQVPEPGGSGKYRVIQGICLLGRNPSLHPGDLRVVKAVDVPALRHLRDVVVFPQNGDRDIPSMCSGGDLDGDDFFVIWDKNLTPKQWNIPPMNYQAPPAVEKSSPVVINDLMKFFVKFMKNDALPTIAHAHLAQSDWLDKGVRDPICLKLAELHSKAVDYVKSGEAAVMPKNLRPRKWPHFMDKKYKPKEQIYNSGKILGLLYNKVESVDFVPQYAEPFDKRILRAYQLEDAMLKTARKIKTEYDTAMKRIMAQMEIQTEFEIYSTFVLSKPRVGSDYKMQEEMATVSQSLKDRFRAACIEAAGGSKDFVKLAPFVAAMYKVTSEEMQIALAQCRDTKTIGGRQVPQRKMLPKFMPLMSFPWIFHEVLGRIAAGTDAQDGLEELGMMTMRPSGGVQQRRRRAEENEDDNDDFVETEEGITHRGELLDLFRPDEMGDGETEDADDDGDGDGNTRARNLEIDTRKLDSAGYIASHEETDRDDEFNGIELDGFLNPPEKALSNSTRDRLIRSATRKSSGSSFSSSMAEDGNINLLTPNLTDSGADKTTGSAPAPASAPAIGSGDDISAGSSPVIVEKISDDEEGKYEGEIITLDDSSTEEEDPMEKLRRMMESRSLT